MTSGAYALGGPPMITDDPNTLDPGKWEINISQLTIAGSSYSQTQVPYLDINYGLQERVHFKYETGVSSVYNTAIPYGGPYATTGVRWKFFDNENLGLSISTYPQYSFYPRNFGKLWMVENGNIAA